MATTNDDLAARKEIAARILRLTGTVPRKVWGAREPLRPLTPDWNYDSVVVHYSGHESYLSMTSIQGFDLEHRHWDDVAYHYAIFPDGCIYEGRELCFEGSHIKLQNNRKLGIVCVGDFDRSALNFFHGIGYSGQTVSNEIVASLKRLSSALMAHFPIRYFGGHREYGYSATCPGANLLPVVDDMRQQLGLQKPIYRSL